MVGDPIESCGPGCALAWCRSHHHRSRRFPGSGVGCLVLACSMRAVVQRVAQASVTGGGKTAAIGKGASVVRLPVIFLSGRDAFSRAYPFAEGVFVFCFAADIFLQASRAPLAAFFHFAGLCVLVGITHDDTKDDSDYLYVFCSAP